MSVVDRSFEQRVEEELAKMDPETLQFLEQLLAENAPAARKVVQNALDESISQDGRKRVKMAVARLDQEYLKYLRDKAAKKQRKEVIMEVRTEAQNGVKKYIQEILDENFNKVEIIEKHYPNIVVKNFGPLDGQTLTKSWRRRLIVKNKDKLQKYSNAPNATLVS